MELEVVRGMVIVTILCSCVFVFPLSKSLAWDRRHIRNGPVVSEIPTMDVAHAPADFNSHQLGRIVFVFE